MKSPTEQTDNKIEKEEWGNKKRKNANFSFTFDKKSKRERAKTVVATKKELKDKLVLNRGMEKLTFVGKIN